MCSTLNPSRSFYLFSVDAMECSTTKRLDITPLKALHLGCHLLATYGHLSGIQIGSCAIVGMLCLDRNLRARIDVDGIYSERAIHGIFNLKMFGVDTRIIHSPSLMKSFFALPGSVIEHKTMGSNIITKIFDFPSAEVPRMITHFDQLMNTFVTQLTKGPGFDRSWIKLLTDIEEIVPSIVTPSSGHKGLRSWERTVNIKVQPNGTIEADLFPLIRNCVGSLSSKEMMGHVFIDSHPDFLEDIWQVDANIMGFVFGMPSWLPSIAKARKSRTRILEKLVAWHTEMEAVGPLTDSDADCAPFGDVSDLMKQRQKVWSERGFSMKARAAVDLSILWA